MPITIKPIEAKNTIDLRLRILRPGQTLDQVSYNLDGSGLDKHFGAFMGSSLVGAISLYPEDENYQKSKSIWRLRGMAVDTSHQGTGLGKKLVQTGLDFLVSQSAEMLWCNARSHVTGFYSQFGFEIVGEEFPIPQSGPHYRMIKRF